MGNTVLQMSDALRERLPNDDRKERIRIGDRTYKAQRYLGFGASGLVLEAKNDENQTVVMKIYDWVDESKSTSFSRELAFLKKNNNMLHGYLLQAER